MRSLRRALTAAFFLWLLAGHAWAVTLLTLPITTAITTTVTGTLQYVNPCPPCNITIQGNFTYGSGGTTADAYVQTTIDGTTWTDIAQFHFTTSSARLIYNLSSLTVHTTQVTPTDGSLASNTAVDGVIGTKLRVKYATTGTYAGGTTMQIDVTTARLRN